MIEAFAEKFLNKIKEYHHIAIFVHKKPDFDAYGSAFGMKGWINDNFPDKKVQLMIPPGTLKPEEEVIFQYSEPLPLKTEMEKYIGIVVDTCEERLILTDLYKDCKELMIIDHHPKTHSFAELEFIDSTYPAASQIIAEIFFHLSNKEGSNYSFSSRLTQYFYVGIMTDTNNFLNTTISPSTFRIISQLVSKGINRNALHRIVLNKTIHHRLMELQMVKSCRLTPNGLIFSIITPRMIKKYKLETGINPVPVLANISNVEVWSALIYEPETKKWKCSLRSENININQIARLYGGGGHKKMAAVTCNNRWKYYRIMATLDKYLTDHNFTDVTFKDRIGCWQLSFIKFLRGYKKM